MTNARSSARRFFLARAVGYREGPELGIELCRVEGGSETGVVEVEIFDLYPGRCFNHYAITDLKVLVCVSESADEAPSEQASERRRMSDRVRGS